MNMTRSKLAVVCMLGAALAAAGVARAEDHGARAPLLPKYQQECGACHTPYAPGMLPAASWQRLMAGLPRHFGTDASLDAAAQSELGRWLQANAGGGKRGREVPPEDRITRSAWFGHDHREVSAAVWKRPAVHSPANCSACHPAAADGRFNEHDVRIPK